MTPGWPRPPAPTVTLESCDQEPIHIPGTIQPHGVLVAFDADRRLRYCSANAAAVIGDMPGFGEKLGPRDFNRSPEIHQALAQAFHPDTRDTVMPFVTEVTLGVRTFDLILHQAGPLVVAEFESRAQLDDDLTSCALKAHRAMARLKRQRAIDQLLAMAVEDIRQLTGFDRVMAYRFRQDDSGEVVAEARDEALDPFLGRRYPASDIPAQARLLYVENTLRLIADVAAEPVPVLGEAGAAPLDPRTLLAAGREQRRRICRRSLRRGRRAGQGAGVSWHQPGGDRRPLQRCADFPGQRAQSDVSSAAGRPRGRGLRLCDQ